MGLIHQLKIFDSINTLEDLADQFVERIKIYTWKFEIIVLAFDRYDFQKQSLKQQTWDDRCGGKHVQVQSYSQNNHQKYQTEAITVPSYQ